MWAIAGLAALVGIVALIMRCCGNNGNSSKDTADGKAIYRLSGSQIRKLPWHDLRLVLSECSTHLKEHDGIFRFDTPLGKPFILVSNVQVLDDIFVKHAAKYKKQHANGILEIFRKTTLPVSGKPLTFLLTSAIDFFAVDAAQLKFPPYSRHSGVEAGASAGESIR